jgi:5'-nucleotidase
MLFLFLKKCNFIIALTHMRWNNDTILAERCPEIDLFLGGHDHDYVVNKINDRWVVKSGTDFREFSLIEVTVPQTINKILKCSINSNLAEKPQIKEIVDSYLQNINKELDTVLGCINADLEGRFAYVSLNSFAYLPRYS